MEDEIVQSISNLSHNALLQLFEMIKAALADNRIKSVKRQTFYDVIRHHNENVFYEDGDFMDSFYFDYKHLDIYVPAVTEFVNNFKKIVTPYLRQWDKGLIKSNNTVIVQPPKANKKLRLNLTVQELAFLFLQLRQLKPDIFMVSSETEIYRFIKENFATKQAGEEEDISLQSIKNAFTNPSKKVANDWVKKFEKMLERSRKV